MQEKNTNKRLKAQPIAYECDLFSGITRLGGVCYTATHQKERMIWFTSVTASVGKKKRALKLPFNTLGCAVCCALQFCIRVSWVCIKSLFLERWGCVSTFPCWNSNTEQAYVQFSKRLPLFLQSCRSSHESLGLSPPVAARSVQSYLM